MPRTFNAPVLVGAGALLRLRRVRLRSIRRAGYAGLECRVVGEAPVTLPVAVSGEAARVRIMVRYILERRQPEPSAGFACGVDCLPFCWTLDS